MLMFKGKSPYLKKPKPQKMGKRANNSQQPGEIKQIGRLHLRTVDLEQQLKQSQRLNTLYLSQIKDLEEDNLTLCARLHELKVNQEGQFRDNLQGRDQLKSEIEELVKVVSCLEQQVEAINDENAHLRRQMEEYRDEAETGRTAVLRVRQMSAEVERSKMKLLQSERYWITRCQTLLQQQQASNEKVLLSKDTEFNLKIKQLKHELSLREQEVSDKTAEIYQLIQHIQAQAH